MCGDAGVGTRAWGRVRGSVCVRAREGAWGCAGVRGGASVGARAWGRGSFMEVS